MIAQRLFRAIVDFDRSLNPIIYGGSRGVTLSSQTAYNELILQKNHRARRIIDWIFGNIFGDKKHCYRCLRGEAHEFPDRELILKILADIGI